MQLSQQQPPRMQNPCTNDQVRLNCGPDAACLKAHLSQLSPSCTMFLKGPQEARPSPSPAPMEGFYSQAFLGQDGQMYIEEGHLSAREGKIFQGEMQGVLDMFMSGFFGQPQPQPQPRFAPSPQPSTSAHPCEAEVTKCKSELSACRRAGRCRSASWRTMRSSARDASASCTRSWARSSSRRRPPPSPARTRACPRSPSPRAVSPDRSSSSARRGVPTRPPLRLPSTGTRRRATTASLA